MNHLTTIAALPTTGGTGSAQISEFNPSRPRFACVCGEPGTAGVAHRQDGPCYVVEQGHCHALPGWTPALS